MNADSTVNSLQVVNPDFTVLYHRTSVHMNDSLSFPSSSKDLISKVQQKDSTLNAQPCNALADSNCTHHHLYCLKYMDFKQQCR